ncbi:MAG: hypothetical protein HC884_01055 [Chloroflexaceae bacterium]|nr:hypothetical protein [Chloroflexaceae bacterium]
MTFGTSVIFALLAYALAAVISLGVALIIKGLGMVIRFQRPPAAAVVPRPRPPAAVPHAESAVAES